MIEIIPAPDNVIAFALCDTLGADDMRQFENAFTGWHASQPALGLCIDVSRLADVTGAGMVAGARADLELFRHVRQFKRLAVISAHQWPGVLVGFITPLLPSLESRSFQPQEQEEALRWAAAGFPATQPASSRPPIRLVPTSKDEVIAFEVDGALNAASMTDIVDEIRARVGRRDRISLLAHIRHFGGVDPDVFGMLDRLVAMKLHAVGKLDRYAIVGAPGWMAKVAESVSAVVPGSEIKAFDAGQEDDAWRWIGARPA